MKKTTVHIKGMHCRSCELLVEDELLKVKGVKQVHVDQKKGTAEICYLNHLDNQEVQHAIADAGYQIGKEERKPWFSRNPDDYLQFSIMAFIVAILALIASDTGIFNLSIASGSYSSLPIVFLVGLTAGLSTCMALVGGLVLGASARFAEKHPTATALQKFKPHLFFNLGRIISFFILGGVIGWIGSFMQLSSFSLGILTIGVGLVMLMLGLQLTELFPRISGINFTLPKGISRALGIQDNANKEYSHKNSMMMGALTFFLPCGFTQAIQLYAISTGNPLQASLSMGVFALGTTPGLLGIGGLTAVIKGAFAKPFFKFAGIIVVLLALFNISNGFNLAGFNLSHLTFASAAQAQSIDANVTIENGVQTVRMVQGVFGYKPNTFTVKKGMPVKWIIDAKDQNTCASTIVSDQLKIRKTLVAGENVFEFTPTETGPIHFSCIMGMYRGQFNVVDSNGAAAQAAPLQAAAPVAARPAAGGCNMGAGGGGCGGCGGGRKAVPTAGPTPTLAAAQNQGDVQLIKTTYANFVDIQPSKFSVKAGQPVRMEVLANDDGVGCMSTIMIPGLINDPKLLEKGKTLTFNFTPTKPGTYDITCAMGVPRGTIQVN